MADTTALKNRIRAAIKANDNQEITGPVLQQALLDIVDELNRATETEANTRQNADSTLQQNINNEATARQNADSTLQQNINNEATARQNADNQLNNLITSIKNNIDNGYVYAGIATPSTVPVSGRVFYVAMQAGTYTNFRGTAVTEGITILKYNGTSWVKEQILFTDGGVFDISAYYATGSTLATYTDLSAALDSNNGGIPQSLQEGGMSVKFVRTYDHKYVQARCMAQNFTTDVTRWAIADEGVYVENPEFVYVKTDAEGKILWAIRTDGNIYYGVGVPQQVINYINERIAELSLDEYEDIVAFLDNLITGDKTLAELPSEKVDKEYAKSLIDEDVADSIHYIENPEFISVELEKNGNIIKATKNDGTEYFAVGVDIANVAVEKSIENPEFMGVYLDWKNNIFMGFQKDGNVFFGCGVPRQIMDYIDRGVNRLNNDVSSIQAFLAGFESDTTLLEYLKDMYGEYMESPEFIQTEVDGEKKVLGGRKSDGTKFDNIGFETPKISIDGVKEETSEDTEKRLELNLDNVGKVISFRDKDGILHEQGIILSSQGYSDLAKALRQFGNVDKNDWSGAESVELPIPDICSIINFGVSSQATSKSDKQDFVAGVNGEIPTFIEYWDKYGNYFKKPILLSAQGSSSMSYWIKNQAFDIDDGSSIKFGNWVAQDSFHVKKYYQDVFRGQCIVGYWLTEQVYQTKRYGERRPWDYLNQGGDTVNAIGKFKQDFDTGALAHPDGFPVHVFFNGKDAGVYAFNLKKDRDNYYASKSKTNNIILDGLLTGSTIWNGSIDWTQFEIRNPKPKKKSDGWELVNMEGKKYDGDFPTELMDATSPNYNSSNQSHVKSAETKAFIERLSGAYAAILSYLNVTRPSDSEVIPIGVYKNEYSQSIVYDKGEWVSDGDGYFYMSLHSNNIGNALSDTNYWIDITSNIENAKQSFESYFNLPFFIDYFLISQVVYHKDGFGKNWIWCTWDGGKWSPTSYDMDSIFGAYWNGTYIVPAGSYVSPDSQSQPGDWTNTNCLMDCRNYIVKLLWKIYKEDIKNRYKELRDGSIFTTDNIVGLLEKWLDKIGYDNLKNDIENVCSYNGVPQTPSYRDGEATYLQYPNTGGFYNSLLRVRRWQDKHFEYLDSTDVFNYQNV